MNFVTSVFKKYIKNETQPDNKGANKLVVEPSGQKPRRSVLKEFDPFAPDSPCPPKLKAKNTAVIIIDEEEIFEDAETSLTSYVCPRNKNIGNSLEKVKTPTKVTKPEQTRESLLIPNLKDNGTQEILNNLNDTVDMSYVEAVENLSQAELNKTSSDENQFDSKKPMNPEILVNNELLNITGDIDRNNGLNEDNFMVDSLERTFDSSNPLNSTIENIQSPVVLNKTKPIEVKVNPTIITESISKDTVKTEPIVNIEVSQIQGNNHKEVDSMIDSLESPDPVEDVIVVLDTTFEKNQYNLIDSLEIVKPEENLEDLNAKEIPLTINAENVEIQTQKENIVIENKYSASESCATLDKTFDTLPTDTGKSETTISSFENQKSQELDKIVETVSAQMETQETVESVNQRTLLQAEDSGDNLLHPTTFETPLSKPIECNGDLIQSDHRYDTVHLNKTFENTSSDPTEATASQVEFYQVNTSNVELKTFDVPPLNSEGLKTYQMNSDVSGTPSNLTSTSALENAAIELFVKESATVENKILDKTFDLDENIPIIEENLNPIVKFVSHEEGDLQKTELVQKKDCESDGTSLEKTMDMVENTIDIFASENRKNKVITPDTDETSEEAEQVLENTDVSTPPENLEKKITTETDKTSSEGAAKVVESVIEQEPIQLELSITQSATNISHIVEEHSVSLKEIIGIDASIQDHANSENIDKAEEVNLTFNADEDAAESSRVMEVLAQSLNQTIDVEESAIADDINSSKSAETSGELNVTIENVKEVAFTPVNGPGIIENIMTEELRNSNTLEKKEREEFENLERQYEEKTQNAEKCTKEAIDSLEAVINKFGEEKVNTAAEEKISRVFLRQDTCEFEALERECNGDAQYINNSDDKKEDIKSVPVNDAKQENLNNAKNINHENGTKAIKRQETQEFEDLERECLANSNRPKECHDDLKPKNETTPRADVEPVETTNRPEAAVKEKVVRDETDLPIKPAEVPVKVKVSGNICSASSSVEIDTKVTIKESCTEIKLNDDADIAKHESVNDITPIATEIPINGFNDRTTNKTDELIENNPNITAVENNQVPKINENITKSRNRLECRPTTRSIRNKTQVIDKSGIINEPSIEIKNENGEHHTSPVSNELAEKERNLSEAKSEELKTEMTRLQTELDLMKTENKRKDKYILTCTLDLEVERDSVIKYKKLFEEYQQTIKKQNEDLIKLKDEEERKAKSFTSLEMAFADVFERYEKAKSIIGQYSKNEEVLKRNIQCAEDQLTKLEAKCSFTKEQYSAQLEQVEEKMFKEKKKHNQEMAKLHAMVKRLEIKSSSLETALKQKTEECRALAALCDDITGETM